MIRYIELISWTRICFSQNSEKIRIILWVAYEIDKNIHLIPNKPCLSIIKGLDCQYCFCKKKIKELKN